MLCPVCCTHLIVWQSLDPTVDKYNIDQYSPRNIIERIDSLHSLVGKIEHEEM